MIYVDFEEGTMGFKTKDRDLGIVIRNRDLREGQYHITGWFDEPSHRMKLIHQPNHEEYHYNQQNG